MTQGNDPGGVKCCGAKNRYNRPCGGDEEFPRGVVENHRSPVGYQSGEIDILRVCIRREKSVVGGDPRLNLHPVVPRALDKLPKIVQESLAKVLGYPYQYPDLDAFTKCLMAVQIKQGRIGFIGEDPIESRRQFDAQTLAILNKATQIESVEDIRLPLQSGTVFARHYHPAPNKKLPMILFYHGGGFVVGGLDTHDEVCRLIAKYAKVQVLSIDYPLAPEASPQLLIKSCEDALAWVYQNRRQLKIYKNRIAVAGDSAAEIS